MEHYKSTYEIKTIQYLDYNKPSATMFQTARSLDHFSSYATLTASLHIHLRTTHASYLPIAQQ